MIINEPCLVLNSNWQPVTFLPIGTVICTMMRDMACAIHPETYEALTFDEWIQRAPEGTRLIQTSSTPIPAPDIVVLKKYGARPPRRVGFNRQNLFRRDQYECQYCGDALPAPKLQVEHVIPKSRGGTTTWENTVAACKTCNSRKADKTPKEARMRLRKQPTAPQWKPTIPIPRSGIKESWLPFLEKMSG